MGQSCAAKSRYASIRQKGKKQLALLGVGFVPGELWWPTPYQYFSGQYSSRRYPERFFCYSGNDQEVRAINELVLAAWRAYLSSRGCANDAEVRAFGLYEDGDEAEGTALLGDIESEDELDEQS